MIDFAQQKNESAKYTDEQVNAKYLELLPLIRAIALAAFRDYDKDRRDEAVQSVLVGAFINVKQLAEKGRLEDAFATPIAWFSISAIRTGRTPGVPQNSKDVMNSRCQFLGRAKVKSYGLAENITDQYLILRFSGKIRCPLPACPAYFVFPAIFAQNAKRPFTFNAFEEGQSPNTLLTRKCFSSLCWKKD